MLVRALGRVEIVSHGQASATCKSRVQLTVEQEAVRLEIDTKHSEGQKLFSQPNAPPPSALF